MLIVRRRALARVYDQQVEGLDLEEDVCVVVFMCVLSFCGRGAGRLEGARMGTGSPHSCMEESTGML